MVKSLGDYNIEQSSSTDVNNIKWTKKIQTEHKPKTKKKKTISPTNIIPNQQIKETSTSVEKIFKVKENILSEKTKNKKTNKKFQKSSASNCKIEPSYTRRGR